MPIARYYNGNGREVMNNMVREYGTKKAKRVFYATENARKKKVRRPKS